MKRLTVFLLVIVSMPAAAQNKGKAIRHVTYHCVAEYQYQKTGDD